MVYKKKKNFFFFKVLIKVIIFQNKIHPPYVSYVFLVDCGSPD